MKKRLRITVASIITLILAIVVTGCATTCDTTFVEKTTIEEPTTKVIESTTKKELTTSFVVTTNVAETTARTAAKKTDLPDYQLEKDTIALFNVVNDYREQNGVGKMILDEELCKLAYIRAQEQEKLEGHQRPDGRSAGTVLTDNNYNYSTFGENIVIGPDSDVNESFKCWQDSAGHDKNMLKEKWTRSGIALFVTDDGRCCYVQLFVG